MKVEMQIQCAFIKADLRGEYGLQGLKDHCWDPDEEPNPAGMDTSGRGILKVERVQSDMFDQSPSVFKRRHSSSSYRTMIRSQREGQKFLHKKDSEPPLCQLEGFSTTETHLEFEKIGQTYRRAAAEEARIEEEMKMKHMA